MAIHAVEWSLTIACTVVFPLVIINFFFIINKWKKSDGAGVDLPPCPKKLPIIGNQHLVSKPPFRSFRDLSQRYGPIMHLRRGEVDTIVVSSPEIAKEVLRDNDPIFADRPENTALKIFWYNCISIAFSPYGGYWRQMRKICSVELLSARSVRSFASIRRDEVSRLVESLRLSPAGEPVNLTQKVFTLMSSITCRAAFGKVCEDRDSLIKLVAEVLEMASPSIADIFPSSTIVRALTWGTKWRLMKMRRKLDVILDEIIHEHEANKRRCNGEFGDEDLVDVLLRMKERGDMEFPIGYDNIKAVVLDMFSGGTESSSSTVDWAMTELLRHPQAMAEAQAEIREMVKERGDNSIDEEDIQKLNYLRLVIMETLRLHPPASLIPRFSREQCRISGYTIPAKVIVVVNIWAIQRDPKYWYNPESFEPERFLEASLDITGNDFRYLPFGSGKRMCPGMTFGWASVALPLAQLLHNFNWKLPNGIDAQALNMNETSGIVNPRTENLFVVATPYQPSP